MGIPPDYDDDVERKNTHPVLFPKVEAEGVISKLDMDVLKRAIGSVDIQEIKRDANSKSIFPPLNTVAKRRSVTDDNKYGPGNRPHWALNKTQFSNLMRH